MQQGHATFTASPAIKESLTARNCDNSLPVPKMRWLCEIRSYSNEKVQHRQPLQLQYWNGSEWVNVPIVEQVVRI